MAKEKKNINKIVQDILFKGGMNKDISKFHSKEDGYYDAQNFRLGSAELSGLPDLETLKGNKLSIRIPDIYHISYNVAFPFTAGLSITIVHSTTSVYSVSSATYANLSEMTTALAAAIMADVATEKVTANVDRNDALVIATTDGSLITSITSSPYLNTETVYDNLKIMGKAYIRNSIILFTTNATTASPTTDYGQIWKLDYSDTTLTDSAPTPTIYLKYHDQLNFSLYNPIEARGYYERSDIMKVYWVDGFNYMRYTNIEAADLWDLAPQQFDIINNVEFDNVEMTGLHSGGIYTCGSVSYCYQYFRRHGAQSVISPVSGLVHLTPAGESASTNENYKGGIQTEEAGKVIEIKINNLDSRFDGIKVIAIHYKDGLTTPNINVIKEQDIPAGGSITITDTGISLYQYTLEDFIAFGGRLVTPKTLEIKDRRLFPANITEEYYDPDIDMRAYRFCNGAKTIDSKAFTDECIIFDGEPGLTLLQSNYIVLDTAGTGNRYLSGSAISVEAITDWEVPDDYDCYLPKGDPSAAEWFDQFTFKYHYEGSTTSIDQLGGKGKNVEYRFIINHLLEDINTDNRSLFTSQGIQAWSTDLGSEYSDNIGYQNYAGAINDAQLRGLQRDEVYRIGCVIRNTKGLRSFVQWIGDIKMPAVYELDLATATRPATYYFDYPTNTSGKLDYGISFKTTASDNIYSNILGMEFKIDLSSLSDVEGFEIVFVKRNDYDKTIVTQGFSSNVANKPTWDASLHNVCDQSPQTILNIGAQPSPALDNTRVFLYLESPDITFKKDFRDYGGDKLRLIGGYSEHADVYTEETITNVDNEYDAIVKKLRQFLYVDNITQDVSFEIEESKFIEPVGSVEVGGLTISGGYTAGAAAWIESWKGSSAGISLQYTPLATRNIVGAAIASGASTMTVLRKDGFGVFNIERELSAQYGGHSYEERSANIYQSTGKYFTGAAAWKNVYGFDTYVTYYDALIASPKSYDPLAKSTQLAVYVPLETTYNLTLRHDTCYSRFSPNSTYSLHESILNGVQIFGASYLPSATDLYLYNNAYSRGNDVLFFIPKPLYFENNIEYDTRILASNHKTDGENIDNWTVYPALNYKDAESTYGSINAMAFRDNKIICFQNYGICIPAINDRSILKDSLGNDIVIGSSGLLERIDYITTDYGCKNKESLVNTSTGLYWVDVLSKTICVLRDKVIPLSSVRGLKEYLNQEVQEVILSNTNPHIYISDSVIYDGTGIITGHNPEFNEVMFTFKNEIWNSGLSQYDKEYFTVAYNEMFEVFHSFYSINSPMYLNLDNKFFHIRSYYSYNYPVGLPDAPTGDYPDEIWIDGYGDYGSIFGEDVSSVLTIIANKHPKYVKVADNIYIVCESFNSDNYNQYNDFFNKIRCYNTYQNTGLQTFVVYDTFNESKSPGQLFATRRDRKWTLAIPRNAIDENISDMDTKDILSVSYLDQTRTFRERLKDRYHLIELTKLNTNNNRFTVQDIAVSMRLSFR